MTKDVCATGRSLVSLFTLAISSLGATIVLAQAPPVTPAPAPVTPLPGISPVVPTPSAPSAPAPVTPAPALPTPSAEAGGSGAATGGPQITPPPAIVPGSSAALRIRPSYPVNIQRPRSTPTLDGSLHEGEWTPFYTVSDGTIQGTVYCNWDPNYLYIAAKTDQASTLLIDIDANDDGWLRGADNLELVVGQGANGTRPTITARLLDATSNKNAPFWSTQALDTSAIQAITTTSGSGQITEIAVPRNMGSLVLQPSTQIGLRVDFLPPIAPSAYVPTQPYEPHLLLDAILVDSQVESAAGINPHLELSDRTVIDGQRLFATLELLNQTDIPVPVRSVKWEGHPQSANPVDTIEHVVVPNIPSTGRLKLGYKTFIPPALPVGSYSLGVTVKLASGKQVSASASFSVVEPIHPQMSSSPDPLVIVGTTNLDVRVTIFSAVPDHFRGNLELTKYPSDWVLDGGRVRSVVVYGKDNTSVSHVRFRLPASTQPGNYTVEGRITWMNRSWDLKTVVHIVQNEAVQASTSK